MTKILETPQAEAFEISVDELGCEKLKRHIEYLEIGDYLPSYNEMGFFIYYLVAKGGRTMLLRVPVDKFVYEGIKEMEGKIRYSNRKFRRKTRLFPEYRDDLSKIQQTKSNSQWYLASRDAYMDLHDKVCNLDKRDNEILQMRVDGFTQNEIACRLGVSLRTVEYRIKALKSILYEE